MSENTTQNATPETPEDDPILVRHAKREALIAAGENPYGHAFTYSHHIVNLDEKYAGLEDGENTEDRVEVAGRVMAKRDQGKIIFMELRDSTGSIQLFCRINALGEEAFVAMKDLDVGDKITYTTSMGTRTYLVETVTKISSSDWSYLSSTTDNRMTLLTCVAGDSSQRWCVQAVQAS